MSKHGSLRPFSFSEAVDDRMVVSRDATVLIDNDLRQRIQRLAALWLQSPVSDERELARIVTIAEAWRSLPETAKLEIEAFSQITNSKAEEPKCPRK